MILERRIAAAAYPSSTSRKYKLLLKLHISLVDNHQTSDLISTVNSSSDLTPHQIPPIRPASRETSSPLQKTPGA